jgi:NDP-sugar pyrophosphorylase family protein
VKRPKDMQIAILAGGLATRLGDLTKSEPKSLLNINGKTFIEYQLERIKQQEIMDVVICTGHLGGKIKHYLGDGTGYGLHIKYSHEDRPLGTAGALKNAEKLLDEIFITMYGDSYLFLDFGRMLSYFKARDKLAMMTVYQNYDHHEKSNTSARGGLITEYSKNTPTEDMVYVDYGAHVFRKETLELVPDGRYFPLEELFPALVSKKQLMAYKVRRRFYEVGSLKGIAEFREYIRGKP